MTDTFSNMLYATPTGTRQNNCYAYALDMYRNSGDEKMQPGDIARAAGTLGGKEMSLRNCDDLVAMAMADAAAGGYDLRHMGTTSSAPCPAGAYKIMVFLDPGDDYHWYRQHKDVLYRVETPRSLKRIAAEFGVPLKNVSGGGSGEHARKGDVVLVRDAYVWSHKQGFSPDGPLLRDACGKFIKDPAAACRDYGSLNYKVPCGTFCYTKNKPPRTKK